MQFTELLQALGFYSVAMAILAFLAQRLLSQWFSKELEDHKANLRFEGQRQLERLRADLQIAAHTETTRFSKLHERRAEVIADLYRHLVDTEDSFRIAMNPLKFVSGGSEEVQRQEQERLNKAGETATQLTVFYLRHRIFFSSDIVSLLEKHVKTVRDAWISYTLFVNDPGARDNPETRRMAGDAKMAAWDKLEKALPDIRAQLEKEFRELLGVSQEQEPTA